MRILMFVGISVFAAGPVLCQVAYERPVPEQIAGPAGKIWSERAEDGELWFRRGFSIGRAVRSASLVVSCDDRFTLWVNGRQLAEETDWQKIVIVDISGELRSGDNTVALHGVNTGGPGALAVWLIWEDSAGARGDLVSDGEWLISDVPVPGWREPEFDDRGWKPAAVHGQVAYGKNVHGGEPHARVYRSPYSQWADGLDNGLAELRSARDPDQARKALDRLEKDLMEARRKLWEQQKRNAGGRE